VTKRQQHPRRRYFFKKTYFEESGDPHRFSQEGNLSTNKNFIRLKMWVRINLIFRTPLIDDEMTA